MMAKKKIPTAKLPTGGRSKRPSPISFRLRPEILNRLKALAQVYEMTATDFLEEIINNTFASAKKQHSRELNRALRAPEASTMARTSKKTKKGH